MVVRLDHRYPARRRVYRAEMEDCVLIGYATDSREAAAKIGHTLVLIGGSPAYLEWVAVSVGDQKG